MCTFSYAVHSKIFSPQKRPLKFYSKYRTFIKLQNINKYPNVFPAFSPEDAETETLRKKAIMPK